MNRQNITFWLVAPCPSLAINKPIHKFSSIINMNVTVTKPRWDKYNSAKALNLCVLNSFALHSQNFMLAKTSNKLKDYILLNKHK